MPWWQGPTCRGDRDRLIVVTGTDLSWWQGPTYRGDRVRLVVVTGTDLSWWQGPTCRGDRDRLIVVTGTDLSWWQGPTYLGDRDRLIVVTGTDLSWWKGPTYCGNRDRLIVEFRYVCQPKPFLTLLHITWNTSRLTTSAIQYNMDTKGNGTSCNGPTNTYRRYRRAIQNTICCVRVKCRHCHCDNTTRIIIGRVMLLGGARSHCVLPYVWHCLTQAQIKVLLSSVQLRLRLSYTAEVTTARVATQPWLAMQKSKQKIYWFSLFCTC
jgi:hypothetical protein